MSDAHRLHRRFDRVARLLGEDAIARLHRARVVIFGVGGVEQGNGVVEAFLMGNHRRSRVHGLPN